MTGAKVPDPSVAGYFHLATEWVRRMAVSVAIGGLGVLMIFAFFTTLDGLMRSIVGRPLDLVRDVGDLVVAVSGASTLAITIFERGNITIKILEPHLGARAAIGLDLVVSSLCAAILFAMAWQFFLYSRSMNTAGEVTFVFGLSKAPFWYVVSALIGVAFLVQLMLAAGLLAKLLGRTRNAL